MIRIASNSDFFRSSMGSRQPHRSATNIRPAVVAFSGSDQFVKDPKKLLRTGKMRQFAKQIKDVETRMYQLRDTSYKQVKALMLERLAIEQEHLGPDSMDVALTHKDLGHACKLRGQENIALEQYEESQENCGKALKYAEESDENYKEALKHYADALITSSHKQNDPAANSLTIEVLESRADIYRDLGELTKAQADLTRALEMVLDETLPKQHEAFTDTIILSLSILLTADENNPREQELELLKTNPTAWLDRNTSPRTVH
jgi:tetratricopeptide (TPR) repeat protein